MGKRMRVVIPVSKEVPFDMTLQHVKRRMQHLLLEEEKKCWKVDLENEFDVRMWITHYNSRMKYCDVPCYITEKHEVGSTIYYVFEAYWTVNGGFFTWDEQAMIEYLEDKMRNEDLLRKIVDK